MTAHGPITPDSLMTLEDYDRWRQTHKAESMAHRRLRSVALGEHMRVQFESETSVRYQIQEMLRIERIFEAGAIAQEIQAYAPLVPDGGMGAEQQRHAAQVQDPGAIQASTA